MNAAPIEVGVAVQPTFWLLRPHLLFREFANFGEFLLGRGRVPTWPGTDVPAGNERRAEQDPIPRRCSAVIAS
jgi:hypothetical protein